MITLVADRPNRMGAFTPSQSHLVDKMVRHALVNRDEVRVVWHDEWKPGMELDASAVVLAGELAAKRVLYWDAPPNLYHGSILPVGAQAPASFNAYESWCVEEPKYVVTFSFDKLHAMWDWHPLAQMDWMKVGEIHRGEVPTYNPMSREWVIEQPNRLGELEGYDVLAFDTELTPCHMFGAATRDQVHVTGWNQGCKALLAAPMQSAEVMKVAHNLQHDLAMCALHFNLEVQPPYFDTMGGLHLLNTELEKDLSPGLTSRMTHWPYHKWLYEVDSYRYNGMDNITCYDGYFNIRAALTQRGLWETALHDHRLLSVLFKMQARGLKVDTVVRMSYEIEQKKEAAKEDRGAQRLMRPVIRSRLTRFEKPHLFQKIRKCPCCGGGRKQALHCASCGGLPGKPQSKKDFPTDFAPGVEKRTIANLTASLPTCGTCDGVGKNKLWRVINPGSDDQVADVLYRGLGIPPRKFKGAETTRADALAKIIDRDPLVGQLVTASRVRADLSTVKRLTPDPTSGRLYSVFNPWGTVSGRVASSEGLLRAGTNLMNVPKKARRFIVPDPGYIFMQPDMSQIEARVVAILSKPYHDGLWKAFKTPIDWPGHERHGTIDSHTQIQQMVSRWLVITRDQAKRLVYAAMYGAGAKQLAVELTAEAHRRGGTGFVSEQQAEAILAAFFMAFPGVLAWHEAVERELYATRTIKSLTGRERHWPGRIVDRKTKAISREVIKEAWSFVPQEVGAHILALGAMEIERQGSQIELLVHIHDALLMQTPIAQLEESKTVASKALSREMFGMMFPCDMKVGENWYEASV